MDDHQQGEEIEDDRLRLILPVPPGFDPSALMPLVEGGRIAGLLLSPAAEPAAMRGFGLEQRVAVFLRDDVAGAADLDGVLLTDPDAVADARRRLGTAKLIGALCAIDRHDAMAAGEAGADWILFGRADLDPAKAIETAAWWSELFVLPCGVTGLIEPGHVPALTSAKISFALPGPALWRTADPLSALVELDLAVAAADALANP